VKQRWDKIKGRNTQREKEKKRKREKDENPSEKLFFYLQQYLL